MDQCYHEGPSSEESSLHTEAVGSTAPDAFGPFRVLHQIGAGALGPVFRAYEPDRDRLVAIKLFRLDLPPERVHGLVAEFEQLIAAELDHPVIAAPRAAGIEGVTAYLAQDYVTAESLDVVIREGGTPPVADALSIVARLADALDYAADRQIVHGALHPRDVLLSPEDFRLVGLGITRALERVGVPAPVRRPYTAPERINGGAWDRRADVFSLAAIAYELVWGRRLSGTGAQAVEAITDAQGGHLPALHDVFARALADDMADRFGTALEFSAALAGAFEGKPAKVSRMVRRNTAPRPAPEPLLPLDEAEAAELTLRATEAARTLDVDAEVEAVLQDVIDPDAPVEIGTAEPATGPLGLGEPLEPLEAGGPPGRSGPLGPGGPLGPAGSLGLGGPSEHERERVEPAVAVVEAPYVQGSLLSPAPAPETSSLSLVWPLALAALVGAAAGFGAGYAVAIRDRPVAVANVAPPPENAAAPAAAAPPVVREPEGGAVVSRPLPPAGSPGTAPVPAPARPAPPVAPLFAGRVLVRSTPAGARVFVDGHGGGETPATVRDLARGPHQVRLVREGYTTVERRIVITAAQPSVTLTVPMVRTPPAVPARTEAPLSIESKPSGAVVFLDGRQVGTTPLTFPLVNVGAHAVRITLEGYRPWSGSVQVSATEPNRVGASLEMIN
jgi:eukaryotic-like serine/threonine-protein kinase